MSKYILNFIIFFVLLGIAVLIYQYWYLPSQKTAGPAIGGEVLQGEEGGGEETVGEVEGLEIEVLQEGQGEPAKNGDRVSVHYTGKLINGSVFDSSLGGGKPFEFTLGASEVIRGWDLGVLGMKAGERRKLTIAPEIGYGERDMGVIPPNSTLIFEVELLKINP